MVIRLIIFILLALIILGGAHYLLYFSIIRFFLIVKFGAKIILSSALFFLSASFIVASILTRWYENIFINGFYIASGFWLGLLLNLIIATLLIWILILISGLFGFRAKTQLISVVIFSLAIIYSAYGSYNAFNPKIKNIEVEIKNLPEVWENKTIVQLSDIHLGRVYKKDFLQKIVNQTNSLNPDIIAITGDLFDGMDDKDMNVYVEPLSNLSASKGVFFVAGNHEVYLGVDRALNVINQTQIKFLNNEMVEVDGLQIMGINFPVSNTDVGSFENKGEGIMGESQNIEKIIKSQENISRNKPLILLYHTPTSIEQSKNSGVNLQLSGHTHKGQLFPLNYITQMIYKGYDYGLHKDGDFSIYITNGVGAWGPPMRTGNTPEIVAIKLK